MLEGEKKKKKLKKKMKKEKDSSLFLVEQVQFDTLVFLIEDLVVPMLYMEQVEDIDTFDTFVYQVKRDQ